MSKSEKVTVLNINCPGSESRVDAEKYSAMKSALLTALPESEPGLTQSEMINAIQPHLRQDLWPNGAKSAWWCKTVQLDLEARGAVQRVPGKPLRWHRI